MVKYLFIISFFACSSMAHIEYTGTKFPPEITCVYCDTAKVDSTYEFLINRKRELDDSIALIKSQNLFLDSVRKNCDTVKWKPIYYKPNKKK